MQAATGVHLESSVTIRASPSTIKLGEGKLTIDSGKHFRSVHQDLTITLDDLKIYGTELSTGNGTLFLDCSTKGRLVGLGGGLASYPGYADFHLSDGELQKISGSGMVLGGDKCGSMTVDMIEQADSAGISGILSIITTQDDATLRFGGAGSTFNALYAAADDGVQIDGSLTTTVGTMHIDSDVDDSNALDNFNNIKFVGVRTVTAKELLHLEATKGRITKEAHLTLQAGHGIFIQDDLAATVNSKPLVILSDMDLNGDGTLTIGSMKAVDNLDGDIQITAWDLDFDGSLRAGNAAITLHCSQVDQSIAIGMPSANMQLSTAELSRVEAKLGLALGSSSSGSIRVGGTSDAASDSIGTLSLIALKDGKQVTFQQATSVFNKGITVQALEPRTDITPGPDPHHTLELGCDA